MSIRTVQLEADDIASLSVVDGPVQHVFVLRAGSLTHHRFEPHFASRQPITAAEVKALPPWLAELVVRWLGRTML